MPQSHQCLWQDETGRRPGHPDGWRDYLILRTSWVYGARGSNFLLTMLRLAQERAELQIVDDQIGAQPPANVLHRLPPYIGAAPGAGGRGIDGRSGIYNLTSTEKPPGMALRRLC